ncbi:tigger transposable element-derived protein 1 [Trichonephila clavipes]|nr:tigger transposable element-derived protein 1 [Trichonephila clavipes]
MGPKKQGVSRTVLTINTKREMIAKVESGQKMADVARQYGLNRSAVCTILAKKDITKNTRAAEGVTKITSEKQRSAIHDKMERLLLVWINEREMKRDVTSMPIIQEKRMPNRTYITKDEKSVRGHRSMKDRLTLLFGANASGDMKLKSLLVYHSENPRALKKIP